MTHPKGVGRLLRVVTEKAVNACDTSALEGEGRESGRCRRPRPFAVIDISLGGRCRVSL